MAAKKGSKKTTGSAEPKKRGRPKKEKKITHVALVVDRSGSMSSVEEAAFAGINEQIKTLKDTGSQGGETFVTYIQFDHISDLVFDKKPSTDLQEITRDQYSPRGTTAMYDAVWTAIKRLKDGVKETKDTAYLVVVISDGGENASREVTGSQLSTEIKQLQASGKWTFAYMLSNQDLSAVQQDLGLRQGNVAAFISTAAGTTDAFCQMATRTANYMSTRSTGTLSVSDFYSPIDIDSDTKK
jgi:uncharacterized protein YegL